MRSVISVRGARTHNLASIDLDLPRDKLIVITGVSGSGKSSLAFDTIYAEGQRRYVESLSAYARQFLSLSQKPDVDLIEGLSPAISIEQKSTSRNPRSTVGTITEIHDYLRLLYARVGEARCPTHNLPLRASSVPQIVDNILDQPEGKSLMLLAPLIREQKGTHVGLVDKLRGAGFTRLRVDGAIVDVDAVDPLDKNRKHSIDVVVDRFRVREGLRQRLTESIETSLGLTEGTVATAPLGDSQPMQLFSTRHACLECGHSLGKLEPKMFSFNSPVGACSDCEGLGRKRFVDANKVLAQPESSIASGALPGWGRAQTFYFNALRCVADYYSFSVEIPWQDMHEDDQYVILYGSKSQKIEFVYRTDRGKIYRSKRVFEGVLHNIERRYRETDSDRVREMLGHYMSFQDCPTCNGTRLNPDARHVFVADRALHDITNLSITAACDLFESLDLKGAAGEIASRILAEIRARLGFLRDVGLGYLTLSRSAETLSGGEAQRIRLASQVSTGLVGVLYVLDEPSIGLHQRDNARLLSTLTRLRDLGNTVIVVEHDEEAIRTADEVVDIGLGAGVHGGRVCAQGDINAIINSKSSLTGDYLSGRKSIEVPKRRRKGSTGAMLKLKGASGNNLRDLDIAIPLGTFCCVTGVSGSGKSTLINQTLWPIAAHQLNGSSSLAAQPYKAVHGLEYLDKVVDIDQSPIGRTPRSNPATYTGLFTPIRELFSKTQEARSRGYQPGRFSFNVRGGRCESCSGDGLLRVEMHFLPDVYVPCDQCQSKRYGPETLEITYRGLNISEVLNLTVEEALDVFNAVPAIADKLRTLMEVGLSYIQLGQSATTLSGGEAQRVKLSKELARRATGQTLYILDEPTTGLHFYDVDLLLRVLHKLCDAGNSVIVIEHNLDVIKTADWILDLGPDGGEGGGQLLFSGTPESLVKKGMGSSYTAEHLAPMLAGTKKPKTKGSTTATPA